MEHRLKRLERKASDQLLLSAALCNARFGSAFRSVWGCRLFITRQRPAYTQTACKLFRSVQTQSVQRDAGELGLKLSAKIQHGAFCKGGGSVGSGVQHEAIVGRRGTSETCGPGGTDPPQPIALHSHWFGTDPKSRLHVATCRTWIEQVGRHWCSWYTGITCTPTLEN